MASFDPENIIARTMFNSLYEEGYTFPERNKDYLYNLIIISAKFTVLENGYNFRIQNNAILEETNPAQKYAELCMKNILNLVVYITTKSEAKFGEGSMSGTVTNKN